MLSVSLGDFKEFIRHGIFGNFILLNLLTLGFKRQNWRKGLLWLTKLSSSHYITTDDSLASEFRTNN